MIRNQHSRSVHARSAQHMLGAIMPNRSSLLAIVAFVAAISLVTASVSAQPTGEGPGERLDPRSAEQRATDLKAGRPSARANSMKYCSYFVPGNWRAATLVGDEWSLKDCSDFAQGLGATHFQVLCMSPDGFWSRGASWQSNPGVNQLPADNTCGWVFIDASG
jgi:hypothetical protein